MSKYTTEVRFICETYAGLSESVGYENVNDVISKARPKVFDFDYTLFDPEYKPVLETKILKHYYTREIAAETVGLWKLWLDARMNEIMPLFNKLYEAETLKYSPLFDTDITTEHHGKSDDVEHTEDTGKVTNSGTDTTTHTGTDTRKHDSQTDTTGETTTNNDDWSMFSDTPQGGLNGIKNDKYLTNATHGTANDKTTGTAGTTVSDTDTNTYNDSNATEHGHIVDSTADKSRTFNNTNEYTEHVFGKRGGQTYAAMMIEYRESLINIDEMIISALSDLFFGLW